jgi:ArsR family transcriptional regulator, virulence genes transcriptional regulator
MTNTARMDEVYRLQADVLKTLSNPRRLEIIHLLADGPLEVSRLAEAMGISQPNVSQHLALMRAAGVVESERDGREVRYRLSDPEIICACETMRGVLIRRLARISEAATRTPAQVVAGRAAAAGSSQPPN